MKVVKVKNLKNYTVLSISLIGACIAGAANAGNSDEYKYFHSADKIAEKYFDQMDKNSDQLVSLEEFKHSPFSSYIKNFEVLQPNADGFVEKDSFFKMFKEAHSYPTAKTSI
ncbi:MAG: hypothetical protein CFH41_02848 [Alphaproteobacteria bacterium MarineAlpha11_Bin1]|nr:MAG: hypothetical protein CFH41_02848 [Alphaproteobacteria bacterium MarineAlpha11_Bin1]|tara:strand:+ start:650 stop:985 length:336 start_codon:yes stop_codon:yes gene_type:complete